MPPGPSAVTTFLGVDGGGTKTALRLISGAGEELGRLEAPSTYYLGSAEEGVELVARVLTGAVATVCAQAGITPAEIGYAFFGLPTYGEVRADLPTLDAAPLAALGHDRYRCDNDMVCGWAGSLGLADGINVISGTGSMAYGQRGKHRARVGGWGELFGDEGSGYWVGLRALRAFTQMSDGRMPAGPLLDVLRDHLGLETDLDLIDLVLLRWRSGRREIAALSRPVVEAARLGDPAAAEILSDAAAELARLVVAARVRLGFGDDEVVPVSYSGGLFAASEVVAGFGRALSASGGRWDVRVPQFPPALGAALYAAQLAGAPLTSDALERLSRT